MRLDPDEKIKTIIEVPNKNYVDKILMILV